MLSTLHVLWSVGRAVSLKWLYIYRGNKQSISKKSRCGFMVLTSAHQVCLSGVICAKIFYPVLTFLKVISSVVPLEDQMKACSARTWSNDSSKPWAIPALGMLKVSLKFITYCYLTLTLPLTYSQKISTLLCLNQSLFHDLGS